MTNIRKPTIMTVKEAAGVLKCSPDKVERLIRLQGFTTYKFGRNFGIDEASFYRWVDRQKFAPFRNVEGVK